MKKDELLKKHPRNLSEVIEREITRVDSELELLTRPSKIDILVDRIVEAINEWKNNQ